MSQVSERWAAGCNYLFCYAFCCGKGHADSVIGCEIQLYFQTGVLCDAWHLWCKRMVRIMALSDEVWVWCSEKGVYLMRQKEKGKASQASSEGQ